MLYSKLIERDTMDAVCGVCKGSLRGEIEKYREWVTSPQKYVRKRINLNIDHVIPRAVIKKRVIELGRDVTHSDIWGDLDNLQLTHKICNNEKADKVELSPRKVELLDKLFRK